MIGVLEDEDVWARWAELRLLLVAGANSFLCPSSPGVFLDPVGVLTGSASRSVHGHPSGVSGSRVLSAGILWAEASR